MDTFLAHPAGHTIVAHAANIIAWFSKGVTEGRTPYQDEFERERQDERWAYRAMLPNYFVQLVTI